MSTVLAVEGLEIRRVRHADDDGVRRVGEAVRAVDGDVRLPVAEDAWARVAVVGGTVVGFSRVDFWDEQDGTRLYLLSGGVDPASRGRGIGRALLAHQEAQAGDHWRAEPGAGPALLGGNADERRPDKLALLLAAGYRVRFTVVTLARDPAGTVTGGALRSCGADGDAALPSGIEVRPGDADGDAALPPGIEVRPVAPEHHPLIHRVLEVCFNRSGLGQHVLSFADYLADVRDEDLWLVAWDGDEIAGVLVNNREDGSVDTPWVAVPPAWRGRGVAQALLQRSLRLLAARGVRSATIRTVQENPHRTVALYEKAGYRVISRAPRYAKPL